MEPLNIESSSDTPKVVFDSSLGIFEISNRCFPEDATHFFSPLLEWVKNYSIAANASSTFSFKLEYYNTASSKQLFKLFILLQELSKKNDVIINWYYSKSDTDMHLSGERYSKLLGFPFNIIEL